MADASCRRELELEIPAEEVSKASEKVAKEFAKMAACRASVRQGADFADQAPDREDIKSEVLQNLVPETVEKAVAEQRAHAGFAAAGGQTGIQGRRAGEVPRVL